MDADSYLRITGRVKDIIIRGGQNISAREVEEHLTAHQGIREAAAVAYPDDQLGEKVCAYVVAEPGADLTLESVREFLVAERRISVRKAPERLIIVDELPMTASGKVQKYILRDRLRQPYPPGDRQEDI
jgi:cyclohexanecarboxylate-CoA ligase/acyl-CoA synthetase